ncbi:MAG: hypothetical protein OXG67_02360 [bacterium]|nr:hypothetical protein [bacterium]
MATSTGSRATTKATWSPGTALELIEAAGIGRVGPRRRDQQPGQPGQRPARYLRYCQLRTQM